MEISDPFFSLTRRRILFVNWSFPVCNGWRKRAWRPLSDENSQSNWRNLSEHNETGVDLEHHWKNRINDIVLCIIVPIDSKYESGKYRRLGRQTFRKKSYRLSNYLNRCRVFVSPVVETNHTSTRTSIFLAKIDNVLSFLFWKDRQTKSTLTDKQDGIQTAWTFF